MISTPRCAVDTSDRDRLLVVGNLATGDDWIDGLRDRFPAWTVGTSATYLSGIAELAQRSVRAVLVCVDPSRLQLARAVAGLRDVAGNHTKLILCCTPELEPMTRRALRSGADDYVIFPLEGDELAVTIGYSRIDMPPGGVSSLPAASMEELEQLSAVLSAIGDKPRVLLDRIAVLTRLALHAQGAMVVVEGAVGSSGEPVTKPVLSAGFSSGDRVVGQLSVNDRADGPYSPADAQKLQHYAGVVANILQAASKQRQWRQLAETDECSGLPNRRYLLERLGDILSRAAAQHFHVTVLLFDVDNFKTYNDTYGHDAGDEILRKTGELFRKQCREQDVVARYGGDEFAVVFWDPQGPRTAGSRHPDSAMLVLERVKEAMRTQTFDCLGPSGTGRLTISGGLATFPWDGRTPDALIHKADQALLAAKRAGKNRIFLIGQDVPD